MMINNVDVFWFSERRSELGVLIMVHWWNHQLEKMEDIPILQELQFNCFFSSLFQTAEGIVGIYTESRFTIQFKVINTKKDQILPIFKNKCLGKKKRRIIPHQDFIGRENVAKHNILFCHVGLQNLDAISSLNFPIISANTKSSFL